MSDYKSIIKGTLNSLGEKAKDLAESGKVKEIYDKGTEKAKVLSRIAKLTLEYNGEGEDLKKAYMEIGKLYYEENSANPQGFFAPLFEKVREILCDQLDLEEDNVTMDSDIIEDFEADSLDVVDLVMSLEDEFSIEIPDEQIENVKTVGDIVHYIEDNT